MGQGTETCTDRPTEVSVIRFVSRNRTIEEIAPKKEVYTCKQRGCGKIFTNQDEYKTHEALEALKIRFICREPGCGEELSDPGSMWRHYQEWHNNETSVFACPYTNCSSVHATSSNLEEHIESCHRQPPTLPTEPEIICFEGPENGIEEEAAQNTEEGSYEKMAQHNENYGSKEEEYGNTDESNIKRPDGKTQPKKDVTHEQGQVVASSKTEQEYLSSNESLNGTKFPKNEEVLVSKENFLVKYDIGTSECGENLQVENAQDKSNMVYVNGDVTITKNDVCSMNLRNQEHRIDLGNLERVFRSGLERESSKTNEENAIETNSHCSDDEEYTPKKQRMSRHKQETYKCDINGCGKKYKYISHYRHHQDSHKLITNSAGTNSTKSSQKVKQGKASTVSFFVCKMPGCGAQVNNVTGLWKHYQDNHANSKPVVQTTKSNEVFRCKVPDCETDLNTSVMLYKHSNETHPNVSISNTSTNPKTGNGNGSFHYSEAYREEATAQHTNFKTDYKAKININTNDYPENSDEHALSPILKKESRD